MSDTALPSAPVSSLNFTVFPASPSMHYHYFQEHREKLTPAHGFLYLCVFLSLFLLNSTVNYSAPSIDTDGMWHPWLDMLVLSFATLVQNFDCLF